MKTSSIPFKSSNYFSKIILDYLEGKPELLPFYAHSPHLNSFDRVIKEKQFSSTDREILCKEIQKQYADAKIKLEKYEKVNAAVLSLLSDSSYTVCTGHQLCLFTGPLYFFYKIISTVKLAQKLGERYPDKNFVPVFWMASEDHDLAEINHFNFENQKITWNTNQTGAVGRMNLSGMDKVLEDFIQLLPEYSSHQAQLFSLFKKAYLNSSNLAEATRVLVHELFHDQALLIVDGDSSELKRLFIPQIKTELKENLSFKAVSEQNEQLEKLYSLQVNPREINLFYLKGDQRNRITKEQDVYKVLDTDLVFTEEQILQEVENNPERFSPNVILRPLYQERILPNLAYIGGGGEIAYWLQLKTCFEQFDIQMPMVLLRNSVLWLDQKQSKYWNRFNLPEQLLFLPKEELLNILVLEKNAKELDLGKEEMKFNQLFIELKNRISQIDASLTDHVEALNAKSVKDLKRLEKKLLKLKKRQETELTEQVEYVKETLFPNGGLQERTDNFSSLVLSRGFDFSKTLFESLDFPSSEFYIIEA